MPMTDPCLEHAALTARLASIERQVRRLYAMLFASVVAVFVLGAVSVTVAQEKSLGFHDVYGSVKISGSEIAFSDPAGHSLLRMYVSENGRPVIRLNDTKGNSRLYLGLTGDSQVPRLSFEDASSTERLYVGLSTENTGLYRTYTSSGGVQTSLEDTFLRNRDTSGTEQMVLGVSTANEPVLKLFDSSHQERVFAGIYDNGASGLTIYNSEGTATWSTP